MLSLPEKPWRNVRLESLGGDRYALVFLQELDDEAALRDLIDEYVSPCLGTGDLIEEVSWPDTGVVLTINDLGVFMRDLAFNGLVIDEGEEGGV